MSLFSMVLLGLAVSLDGFGVGLAYGVRNLKIPFVSLLIISISSAAAILISMFTGRMAAYFFSAEFASFIGGIILVGIGIWIVMQAYSGRKLKGRHSSYQTQQPQQMPQKLSQEWQQQPPQHRQHKRQQQQRAKNSFGGITELLKEPQKADFDRSGEISGKEAVVLGIALAMDAFGAGFGAALMGFNPFATSAAVGLSKIVLVSSGFYLGKYYLARYLGQKASCLSGAVLILLGIMNLFNLA